MMWSDAVLRALAQNLALPTAASWLAPRWFTFPILVDSHDVLRLEDTNEEIGERFTFKFFKNASAANAYREEVAPGDWEEGGGEGGGFDMGSDNEGEEKEEEAAPRSPARAAAALTLEQLAQSVMDEGGTAATGLLRSASVVRRVELPEFPELDLSMCDNAAVVLRTAQQVWERSPETHLMRKQGMFALTFTNFDGNPVGFAIVSPLDVDLQQLTMLPTSQLLNAMRTSDKKSLFRTLAPSEAVPPTDSLVNVLRTKLVARLSFYNLPDLDQATVQFVSSLRDTLAQQLSFQAADPRNTRDVAVVAALNQAWRASVASSIALVPVVCAAAASRARRSGGGYYSAVFGFVKALLQKLGYQYVLVPQEVATALGTELTFTRVVLKGARFDITNSGRSVQPVDGPAGTIGTYYAHSV